MYDFKVGDLVQHTNFHHTKGEHGIVVEIASFSERYDNRILVYWMTSDYKIWENIHMLGRTKPW